MASATSAAAGPGACPASRADTFDGSFSDRKEQQLVFLLVRQLAAAQIEQAHPRISDRLWQEVAALDLDPERITWLLYGGHDLTDPVALAQLDQQWQQRERLERQEQRARRAPLGALWWRRRSRPLRPTVAGHRTVPPTTFPERR